MAWLAESDDFEVASVLTETKGSTVVEFFFVCKYLTYLLPFEISIFFANEALVQNGLNILVPSIFTSHTELHP